MRFYLGACGWWNACCVGHVWVADTVSVFTMGVSWTQQCDSARGWCLHCCNYPSPSHSVRSDRAQFVPAIARRSIRENVALRTLMEKQVMHGFVHHAVRVHTQDMTKPLNSPASNPSYKAKSSCGRASFFMYRFTCNSGHHSAVCPIYRFGRLICEHPRFRAIG